MTGAVRWRECVSYIADQGVTQFVECGSGKVLAGLLKRIAHLKIPVISTIWPLADFAEAVNLARLDIAWRTYFP